MTMSRAPSTGSSRVGAYEIIRKIGSGGTADVYLARQPSLDRPVAVKILSSKLSDDADIRKRFDQEALTIARLHHPNIIHVIDRGVEHGRYYFVMEYVDGENLKELARSRRLTVAEKCDVAVQCLKALDFAHKNGVIHRDIKPANILIDQSLNAHVADFGIAQLIDPRVAEHTATAGIMGTPAYMSPEQRVSGGPVTRAADIYSMGMVLYELLTGEKPQGTFRPASSCDEAIPVALDEVISRALARDAGDRYATAVEFKDAILAALVRESDTKVPSGSSTIVREAPRLLGNCTYLDTIKEHPYGATYLVEDRESHELFVIKKIVKRKVGLKEARLLSRLKHPHIVNIFGADEDPNRAMLLMQYARNGSLSDRLVRRLPWRQVADILQACLEGLDFAHKNHIVHGNLRPSNILISKDHDPWLSDFGLPAHYAENGSNWYGAPEGRKSIAGDIYALGVIAYQLCTNQLPLYDRRGALSFAEAVEGAPAAWIGILEKMLERNVATRYPACDTVLHDLNQLLRVADQPLPRMSSPVRRGTGRGTGRYAWWIGFAAGVVAAVLLIYLLARLDPSWFHLP